MKLVLWKLENYNKPDVDRLTSAINKLCNHDDPNATFHLVWGDDLSVEIYDTNEYVDEDYFEDEDDEVYEEKHVLLDDLKESRV